MRCAPHASSVVVLALLLVSAPRALRAEGEPSVDGAAALDAPRRDTRALTPPALAPGRFRLALSPSVLYEISRYPNAALLGSDEQAEAPGLGLRLDAGFTLTDTLEARLDLGVRYLHFGDIAASDEPGAAQALHVGVLAPTLGLSLRLRPFSRRLTIGAGAALGFVWLFGDPTRGGVPIAPRGATAAGFGELRGEASFLLGDAMEWELLARFRFVGYPTVEGVSTLAIALELGVGIPVL
jgi:hypothetical protein